MPQILVFVLFFAGVYFLLLRPQQQRVRRQRELITAIGVGDRVVTAGGLIGRVVALSDDRLQLEVADGVVLELLRLAISRRLDESEPTFSDLPDYDHEREAYYGAAEESAEGEAGAGGGAAVEPEAVPEPVAPTAAPSQPPKLLEAQESPGAPAAGAGPKGAIEEAAAPAPRQDPI